MDREEGEMSDDNAMAIDEENDFKLEDKQQNETVLYKAEKDGIIVKRLEKVDAVKLEERARRFGLNLSGNRVVTQKQIDELYAKSAGIESENERHFRFDTLHLNGVDGLATKEIFEYLEDYKPVSLEKIDDVSCNIVCQDHISAALALLVHSREIKNEPINKILTEKSHHHWREGMPHPKKDLILMRFATNGDKKVSFKNKAREVNKLTDEHYDQSMDPISKNPWGDLCKSWGVYDHQEVFQRRLTKLDYEDDVEEPREKIQIRNKKLASRLGKRQFKVEESEDSNSDSEWKRKSKTPRMRMHADDEESKLKIKPARRISSEEDDDSYPEPRKDTFAPLSIEVVNTQDDYKSKNKQTTKLSDKFKCHNRTTTKIGTVQSRLGVKVSPQADQSDDPSSDESEHYVSSRVQKVTSTTKNPSSVWSRLDTSTVERSQNDLRKILKSKKETKPDDLRERISKAKKSNLRIEIDNY